MAAKTEAGVHLAPPRRSDDLGFSFHKEVICTIHSAADGTKHKLLASMPYGAVNTLNAHHTGHFNAAVGPGPGSFLLRYYKPGGGRRGQHPVEGAEKVPELPFRLTRRVPLIPTFANVQ